MLVFVFKVVIFLMCCVGVGYWLIKLMVYIMYFEWDEVKDVVNCKRYGVLFVEVCLFFVLGFDYFMLFDVDYFEEEDCFILIGFVGGWFLIVVWIEIEEELICIISLR